MSWLWFIFIVAVVTYSMYLVYIIMSIFISAIIMTLQDRYRWARNVFTIQRPEDGLVGPILKHKGKK